MRANCGARTGRCANAVEPSCSSGRRCFGACRCRGLHHHASRAPPPLARFHTEKIGILPEKLIKDPSATEDPMRKFVLAPVLLLCLTASPTLALSGKPYLTASDVDFPTLLPPPPKEDSGAGKRDVQALIDLQKDMTPERMANIHRDLDQSVYTVAGPVL